MDMFDPSNPPYPLLSRAVGREFEGTLVRHATFVFMDVVWLSQILKPLLNHDKIIFDGKAALGDTGEQAINLEDEEQKESWKRLKGEGGPRT
eukprot:jgi/Undpi1/11207/HiC_scaffold_30.g13505.m1